MAEKNRANWLVRALAGSDKWRRVVPRWVIDLGRRSLPLDAYNRLLWARLNPHVGTPYEWEYAGSSDVTVGIVFDPSHYHRYFMTACQDMDVTYKVVDVGRSDWIQSITEARCDVWVVWPLLATTVLKDMIDERTVFMKDALGCRVYPPPEEIWLLDNKMRVRDWLATRGFPHPQTWCFFDFHEAMDFASRTTLPVVFKSLHGGVSHGVHICRERKDVERLVKLCFGKGFHRPRSDPRDRQWGVVLFQEYLPDAGEHRVIRIGDSYIYIEKVRKGDFHSGSGEMRWGRFRQDIFELARAVMDAGSFWSMDVDIFETRDGRLLVNELHTLFHGPQIEGEEGKGRYREDEDSGQWVFESGNFYRNYCANLRVQRILDELGDKNASRMGQWLQKAVF